MNCKSFFSVAYKVVMATGVIAELVNIVVCYNRNGGKLSTTNGAVAEPTAAPQNGVTGV
jgi:hypothetical protein